MTQGQVAASDVTTAYISRIEDGQRRPEAQLLERMARRMNASLEELLLGVSRDQALELQVALDHAELELASGNAQGALDGANAVLAGLAESGAASLVSSAQEVRAYALEALGDLDGAILALEDIVQSPKANVRWLKALIALSRCYRDSGDLSRAISVGEDASRTIEELGLEGLTEAIQLSITVSAAYVTRGDLGHAMRICRRAMDAAERHNSPVGLASAYWEASIIEAGKGEFQNAQVLARRALSTFEASEDSRNLARLRAEIANMQLQSDPPDPTGALATLEQAEKELSWSASSTHDLARARLTRARACFLLGDHEQAIQYSRESVELAPAEAPMARVSGLTLQGQIAAAQNLVPQARELYREAILLLAGIGADRGTAQLWFELGGLLSEIGETEDAMDAFRRAAASTGLHSQHFARSLSKHS